jgi:DNA-binding transcriptional ArsR family regulator
MQASADHACRLMKVLTNPDRLLILCQLTQQEKCVSELQDLLGIVQPTLSQQLTVLRKEKLVTTRREGKNIYYRFSSPQALAVMEVLYAQFCKKTKVKKCSPLIGLTSHHGAPSRVAFCWALPPLCSFSLTGVFSALAEFLAACCLRKRAMPGGG